MRHYLKTYPLTLCCLMLIWYLCLFTPPRTRLAEIPLVDKWTHLCMYLGTCSVLWCEYLKSHKQRNYRKLLVGAVLLPVIMSGCIELIQAWCTTTRSGEWLDFLANTAGVLLAALFGRTIYPVFFKKKGPGEKP